MTAFESERSEADYLEKLGDALHELRMAKGALREEQERMEVRLAAACDVIEQKYGAGSDVLKDVHNAFCEPSPLAKTHG